MLKTAGLTLVTAAVLLTGSAEGASSFTPPYADVDQGQGKPLELQKATTLQYEGDKPCNENGYTMKNSFDPATGAKLSTPETAVRYGCYPVDPEHIPWNYNTTTADQGADARPVPEWANGVCYTGTGSNYNAKASNKATRLSWTHCEYDPESIIVTGEWPDGETTVTAPSGTVLDLPPPGTPCAKRWNFNPGFLADGVTNDLPDYVSNACVPANGYYMPFYDFHSDKVKQKLESNASDVFWCFTGRGTDGLLDDSGYNPNKEPADEQKQFEWAFCVDPLAQESTSSPTTQAPVTKSPTGTGETKSPTGTGETASPTQATTGSPVPGATGSPVPGTDGSRSPSKAPVTNAPVGATTPTTSGTTSAMVGAVTSLLALAMAFF